MPTLTDRFARELFWLALILAGYFVLATIYSLVTPLFEASDELWHYPMVKYVADHDFGLPVQRPGLMDAEAPWRQEGGQPPLYYLIGAAATFWINTSDLPEIRRINPHANIGEIWPDGNANMVVHHHERESFPWSGTVLAMHVVRFLSILMGLGTVYRDLPPGPRVVPRSAHHRAGGSRVHRLQPDVSVRQRGGQQRQPVHPARQPAPAADRAPDQIRHTAPPLHPVGRGPGEGLKTYLLLGLVAGAGMLAKFQIGFMLPLIALALLIVSIRRRDWRPVVIGGLISGGLTILIAGWWYARNYDLYGDATGINVFLDIVGRRAVPADLRQLWTERETFMMSFWGFFGGLNVPMRGAIYTLFNLFAALSLAGLVYALIRFFVLHSSQRVERGPRGAVLTLPLTLARLISLIWIVVVFVSLISWTRQTWASQGRLWFSALAAINVWLAAGIAAWSPRPGISRAINFGVSTAAFVGIAAIIPWNTIRPAYTLDEGATWNEHTLESGSLIPACFQEPDAEREALCVAAYPLAGSIQPGDYLRFSPAMTVKQPMTRDWSLFVHLVGEDGIIEAQRDVYPGGGLIATSDSEPGDAWNNRIAVRVPEGIYAPQTLDVYLGFYHLPTLERMDIIGTSSAIDPANNRLYLGQIRLETPPGTLPNPVDVDFGGLITLHGYEITDRSLAPGELTVVTLYGSAQQPLATNYIVSIQIIDPDPARLTKAAQDDRSPDPSMTEWEPGTIMTERRTLTILPDAAKGRYRLMVRVYDDPAHPLRVRTGAGGQSEDFVWLSWIQVEEP